MFCKKCGKEIPDDSIYCNHCGTRQTPKKIVVEFNKPSLASIDGDNIRNGIFRQGRFLRKSINSLKPLALSLLIIVLVTGAIYGITYYSYYYLNLPPKANLAEIELYREKGIIAFAFTDKEGHWSNNHSIYRYRNPSEILLDCKWDLDDDMIDSSSTYWFDGNSTNINDSRIDYLKYRSGTFASYISLTALVICFLYYLKRLFVPFRKWLYKR